MKNLILILALVGCGDNLKGPADAKRDTTTPPYCSTCPPAPSLGAQIDRMGRPAINTALDHGFAAPSASVGAAKDAYNQDSNSSTWVATNLAEFSKNLAIVDALDTGMCNNGICEAGETNATCGSDCLASGQIGSGNGCGNQALYNGKLLGDPGNPNMMSYRELAAILADDELYVDTTKTNCSLYLAVEFGVATTSMPTGGNTTCGGRAPADDVMDFTLSVAAMGIKGFDIPGGFIPQLKDNAGPHTDYLADFPYLGLPH